MNLSSSQDLKDAYALSFGPLARDSMLNELHDEQVMNAFDEDLWLDEFRYLQELLGTAYARFSSLLNTSDDSAKGAALICGEAFFDRLSKLSELMSQTAAVVAGSMETDGARKELGALRMKDVTFFSIEASDELQRTVDFTQNRKWKIPVCLEMDDKEVGFSAHHEVYNEAEGTSFELTKTDKSVPEVPEMKRTTQRKATGYPGKKKSEGPPVLAAQSPKPQHTLHAVHIVKKTQSREEIADISLVDPTWNQSDRHERRFSRIRQRIPTGHPSTLHLRTMELGSMEPDDEEGVSDIIREYSRRSTAEISDMLDEATLGNTLANTGSTSAKERLSGESSGRKLRMLDSEESEEEEEEEEE